MKVKHLIIDAAGFVKNLSLWEYGEELYSIPEVIAELRDKATRQRYESLPVAVKMREPQPWAIRFINHFSKKTGDYAVLSLADVKLLALTYELEIEARGSSDHLRTEPQKPVIEGPLNSKKGDKQELEGFHLPKEKLDIFRNSSETLPSETQPDDTIISHDFDSTHSDTCDYKSPVIDTSSDQDSTLSPAHISPCIGTLDSKQAETVLWCHMVGLEDFLTEHSYIGGHIPTSDDSNVYRVLIKEYPQFRPSRKDKSALALSAFILPPSSNMRPLHSTFPCIRRWSYHISSFSEEERNLFSSSNRDVAEVLHEFGTRLQNREESFKLPELIGQNPALLENVLQEDLKSLSLNCKEQLDEEGNENSDNEDELSRSADESSLHAKDTDEGEEADIEDGNESEEFRSGNSDEEHLSENDRNEDGVCFDHDENDNVDVSFDHNEDDDDDEGWITPCNVKRYKLKEKNLPAEEVEQDKNVLVACVTSDFAIQNVLKHIGLSVMGVEGKIIREIKTFTLRCHACFKLCSDMTKIFCPKCGNKTLKRVAVTINPDGTQKVWINFKKPINTRGMIFTLPKPRGGQHARNPILVADQKEARQFSSKMSKKKINPLHEDYDPDNAPFAVRDVYTRAAQLGYMGDKCHNHYYWERKNPNERTKKYKKKK